MDKSYRLKMIDKLSRGVLTEEYIINCIAKDDGKINQLAYKKKQYRNDYNNFEEETEKLLVYRTPFVDVLVNECSMTVNDIKKSVVNVKEKNIPTKAVCDQIRNMLVSGDYWIE